MTESESKKAEHERRCDTLSTSLEENLQVDVVEKVKYCVICLEKSKDSRTFRNLTITNYMLCAQLNLFAFQIIDSLNDQLLNEKKLSDDYKNQLAVLSCQVSLNIIHVTCHMIFLRYMHINSMHFVCRSGFN